MEHFLAKISIMLVPALFAVTLHEVSHGFVAERLGDPTARLLGRLTLNPIRHLDPIGTIALLVFGFGWARPVPVNFNNLNRPQQGMIWVALAGPATNFAVAGLSALFLRGVALTAPSGPDAGTAAFTEPIQLMAAFSLLINVILGVFNLFPIPPLDGGRVLTGVLPAAPAQALARIEPFGFLIIIGIVFLTDLWGVVLSRLVFPLVSLMAGPQTFVVERTIEFLFAR